MTELEKLYNEIADKRVELDLAIAKKDNYIQNHANLPEVVYYHGKDYNRYYKIIGINDVDDDWIEYLSESITITDDELSYAPKDIVSDSYIMEYCVPVTEEEWEERKKELKQKISEI